VHLICYSLPTANQLQKRLDCLNPKAVSLYLIKGNETPKQQLADIALMLRDADKLPQLISETVLKEVSCQECYSKGDHVSGDWRNCAEGRHKMLMDL